MYFLRLLPSLVLGLFLSIHAAAVPEDGNTTSPVSKRRPPVIEDVARFFKEKGELPDVADLVGVTAGHCYYPNGKKRPNLFFLSLGNELEVEEDGKIDRKATAGTVMPTLKFSDGSETYPDYTKVDYDVFELSELLINQTWWPVGKSKSGKSRTFLDEKDGYTYFIRQDKSNKWLYLFVQGPRERDYFYCLHYRRLTEKIRGKRIDED